MTVIIHEPIYIINLSPGEEAPRRGLAALFLLKLKGNTTAKSRRVIRFRPNWVKTATGVCRKSGLDD